MPRRGRGGACCGGHGGNDQAGADVLHSMVSGTSSASTGRRSLEDDRAAPGSQASQAHRLHRLTGFAPPGPSRRARA
jgi:hypothetical protein